MRMTRITGERGLKGRRFRRHATGATVLVAAVRKAATFRHLAGALTISAIVVGLAVTPASAQDPGTITSTNNNFTGALGLGPGTNGGANLPKSVCPKNFWAMDLKTGQQIGSLPLGSGVISSTTSKSQAVTKLDFNPIPGIKCTQANIVVEYEGPLRDWTVDIGDSLTNNGFGGGSGSPGKACAEVQVLNSIVTHYRDCKGSGVLPLLLPLVPNPLSLEDGALKFVVKNDYLSVGQPSAKSTGTGTSFHLPDAGLPDPDGSKIFAAFNRVISGPGDREGTGARRVMITME